VSGSSDRSARRARTAFSDCTDTNVVEALRVAAGYVVAVETCRRAAKRYSDPGNGGLDDSLTRCSPRPWADEQLPVRVDGRGEIRREGRYPVWSPHQPSSRSVAINSTMCRQLQARCTGSCGAHRCTKVLLRWRCCSWVPLQSCDLVHGTALHVTRPRHAIAGSGGPL
jgi:hypothetical protein